MNGVEYLIGAPGTTSLPLPAYSQEAIDFSAALSATLMKSPALRAYPDISALAFWCRKANLSRLKTGCPEADQRLGRGLCFHIAPGNIPVNFAFSYLFGLLAGCSNIVRMPSRAFPQAELVCNAIADTLQRHPEIKARTAFVRYTADTETTADFCRTADARLIWGGDATIAAVRGLPTNPRCVDVCFADRYSICVLSGRAMCKATDDELRRLAEGFYNDTYLMDQNACSSPQLICWLEDDMGGRDRFWDAVHSMAKQKYVLQTAVCVDKYTHMCEDAIELETLARVGRRDNLLYRAELSSLTKDVTMLRGRGGYFYEYALAGLDTLAGCITDKFQTVTYFGVDPTKIQRFATENRLRGIDRIVPVGKAMDIGLIWDGFDLIRVLSRIVNVE